MQKVANKNSVPSRADYQRFNALKLDIARTAKTSKEYERRVKLAAKVAGV